MSKKYRKIFAIQIRFYRLLHGWSQEELAENAGLHRTYISAIERGERNICLDNIVKIATAFNIDISDLLKESISATDIYQCKESSTTYSIYHIKQQINADIYRNDAYMRHFAIFRQSTCHEEFFVMCLYEQISKEAPGTQYQTSPNQPWLVAGNAC